MRYMSVVLCSRTLGNEHTIPLLVNVDSFQSFLWKRDTLEGISCTYFCRYWLLGGNIHDFSIFFLEGILPLQLLTCVPLLKPLKSHLHHKYFHHGTELHLKFSFISCFILIFRTPSIPPPNPLNNNMCREQ